MRRLTGFAKRKGSREESQPNDTTSPKLEISGPVGLNDSKPPSQSVSSAASLSGLPNPTRSSSGVSAAFPQPTVQSGAVAPQRSWSGTSNGSIAARETSGAGPAEQLPTNLARSTPWAPPSPVGSKYTVLYDYTAQSPTELSLRVHESIVIISVDPSNSLWLEAESVATKSRGWVPASYVAPALEDERAEVPLATQLWYHGKISRSAAEFHLRRCVEGDFLVRESETAPGTFTVSVVTKGEILHYRVTCDRGTYSATTLHQFRSLSRLVEHYKVDASMGSLLVNPVPKGRVQYLGVAGDADARWEINRADILFGEQLGAGQFGEVYVGSWLKYGGRKIAVKTLKRASMEPVEFLKEAEIMKKLRHPGLVQLLGVCTTSEPLLIVTEFMNRGSLLDVLRSDSGRAELDARTLLYVCTQVVTGMTFLESQNFIHRDLAARNCLVGDGMIVKIADFGLSRLLQSDGSGGGEAIYTAHEGAKFPIKWTAPEALRFNVFSTKSDVWAFGVLLWEVYTLGSNPYPGLPLQDVLPKLDSGYRMPQPQQCTAAVYAAMLKCWEYEPDNRPTFVALHSMLEGPSVHAQPAIAATVAPIEQSPPRSTVLESSGQASASPPSVPGRQSQGPRGASVFELRVEDASGSTTVLRSDDPSARTHLSPPQRGHARAKSDGGAIPKAHGHVRRKSDGRAVTVAADIAAMAQQAIGACRGVMLTGHQLQQGQVDLRSGLEQLITEASQAYCAALAMKDSRMNAVLRDMHTQVTAVQQAANQQHQPTPETVSSASYHLPQIAKRLFDIVSTHYH